MNETIAVKKEELFSVIDEIKRSTDSMVISDHTLRQIDEIGDCNSLEAIHGILKELQNLTKQYRDVVKIDTAKALEKSAETLIETDDRIFN